MFEALSRELLNGELCVRFEARGTSMSPSIRDREIVHVTPVIVSKLGKGDIVLTKGDSGFPMHRLVIADHNLRIRLPPGATADWRTIRRSRERRFWDSRLQKK